VKLVANDYIQNCEGIEWDLICCPGGLQGSKNLSESMILKQLIINQADKKKLIGAICAAPAIVLHQYGILHQRSATCYPAPQFRGKTLCCEIEDKLTVSFP
jgi:protein deglycase